ncbi:hypothetical protein [Flavihumibacter petaseus]|uniref:Uncharacterized protein n=1 Tax=Flavihumibacter petaseus NBRC 106054 TaxID=1220578 RepID=A0A0E9MXW8_9BACT|nr:hypothetical protein [Flavihumibacter petaseus]GAO42562.1 hypothetical protein FPE01S_01_15770 [Flavihumibacter petaseus NBRC 106054]
MIRYLLSLSLLLLSAAYLNAQSYGLAFNSHAVVQENRTALDLSPNDSLCFGSVMQMDFDLNFLSGQQIYFGYIVRLVNSNQNIDLVCTQNTFKVVVGQQLTSIVFSLDSAALFKNWSHFSFTVDAGKQTISLKVNGEDRGSQQVAIKGNCYKILWGANDHYRFNTRDLPPMQVKDIRLLDEGKEKYFWSLADTSGVSSTDRWGNRVAAVKHPVWIKPRHQYWEEWGSFVVGGNAAIAYNVQADRLYIAGSDSLGVVNPAIRNNVEWLVSGHPNFQLGNQAVFDPLTNRIYDFSVDQRRVISLDPADHSWSGAMHDSILTEFWHANKFVSPIDTALYMVGGYGQLKYKNSIYRYGLTDHRWEKVAVSGDAFTPRYLAALGTNPTGDTAFILGGYGSPTGDQMLNPGNYYDMFAYDVRQRKFRKLFAIDSANPHHVFANSLVMDPDNKSYYALIFENGSFDTHLQLVKGGLDGSALVHLGNPIPYAFYDIQSFADLYFSPRSSKLIAVTLFSSPETEKNKTTRVRIYTIDFPAEAIMAGAKGVDGSTGKEKFWWVAGALVLAALFGLWWRERARQQQKVAVMPGQREEIKHEETRVAEMVAPADPASRVQLFGQFLVTDSEGNDITKSFTPLLKELFLLILIYTYRNGKGISADALTEMLWHDKSQKDAKNNRSVNLAKLKTVLEKTGHGIFNREGGYWQFVAGTAGNVDYQQFTRLQKENQVIDNSYMSRLLSIAEHGPFLQQTEYNWLDDIKSDVSNQVIDDSLRYIRQVNLAEEAEPVIEICNCIFQFDRLNEDALEYKCKGLIQLKRHALANTTYVKFTKEYKEIYGEDFAKSFNEVVRNA